MMVSTVGLEEINKIINSEHNDPHSILGIHLIEEPPLKIEEEAFTETKTEKELISKPKEKSFSAKKHISIRAFFPDAKNILVLDIESDSKKYGMNLIHKEGFFEAEILERNEIFKYKFGITLNNGAYIESYDSFSFPPTISEFDLYLFNNGTNYEIFDKLGSHVLTHQGINGVSFSVWAPNAKRVSVVGDFNNWDGRRHSMRRLLSSGVWEIFIPGLKQFDRYMFEIKTLDNKILKKSDPFGNFHELRPSTASLIYDINSYTWGDEKFIDEKEKENPLNGPINIYEISLTSWERAEDDGDRFLSYVEYVDRLIPYILKMGYTHIELMPILEYPFDGSWGYQVTGYFAPTSRFGNPDEFMYFIDKFHQNGIGVILDWVPAHFPKDGHGLSYFDGTALFEHENPMQGEHPEWGTSIYNYGRSEVKNFLISSAIFWFKKYHIDGLRVDAIASMLYLDYARESGQWIPNKYGGHENIEAAEFIKHMNSVVLGRFPNNLMIAEDSTQWKDVTRPVKTGGLGFSLKWNMGWMNDILAYMKVDPLFRKYYQNNLTFSIMYYCNENFVLPLSHDEVVHGKKSLVDKMPGDIWQKFANLRLLYIFMYGHPGKKLIFMGNEFAQFREWTEEASLEWFMLKFEHHTQMQKFVKKLNHFYLSDEPSWYDDFNGSGFEWINCDDNIHSLVSFIRKGKDGDITIFVCNFTPVPHLKFKLGIPLNCSYREILNSDSTEFGGSGVCNQEVIQAVNEPWNFKEHCIFIDVPPLGGVILKPIATENEGDV